MDIKTKLSVGDKFYIINCSTFEKHNKCDACEGLGKIELKNGKTHECPECWGKGYLETYGKKNWRILDDRTPERTFQTYGRPVGKINIEIEGGVRKYTSKITYSPKDMGNFYYEENCFATEKEAKDECDKRNLLLENEV